MKRVKRWLVERFLPRYAYETVLVDLESATEKLKELQQTIERQKSYISGLEYALRHLTPTVVVEGHEQKANKET